MHRNSPRLLWLAIPLACALYFYRLGAAGLIGPDEPRYASIAREMAHSGDWITPRLWGQPWFEKPALLYWMSGAAFRLGLGPDLAPRLPVALMAVAFLVFYWWIVRREFGPRAAWLAALILGTCGLWLGFSWVGATDLPMTAAFSAAMLLAVPWIARGDDRLLPAASAMLGVAVLAKGLPPLALAAPAVAAAWWARRSGAGLPACPAPGQDERLCSKTEQAGRPALLVLLRAIGPALAIALPWYLLCYWRNGPAFIDDFFWKQHIQRITSTAALKHGQPWWFYLPVFVAGFLPWSPLLPLIARRAGLRDPRRAFLLAWVLWGLVLFSAAANKLPGYVLPLFPAAALLAALALDESGRGARACLAVCALLLIAFPIAAPMLPAAVSSGLSRASFPAFHWTWLLPAAAAVGVWLLDAAGRRVWAVALIAAGVGVGVVYVKQVALPQVDQFASSRSLWRQIEGQAGQVCIENNVRRDTLYGLNYYSVQPLPECSADPRPIRVRQEPGRPAYLVRKSAMVDPVSTKVVISPFRN